MRPRNISVIIISPLLGYKTGNKVFFLTNEIEQKIKTLKEFLSNPDIVLVIGNQNIERKNYRVIQNQLYYDSGEVEQVRLGIQATIHKKILIIKDNYNLEIEKIQHGIKKGYEFTTVGCNESNPGITIDNNKLINIAYGLNPKFNNVIFINNRLKEVEDFVSKKHNSNKNIHEIVQHLINTEPICVY